MRTNIEVDEKLLARVMELSGAKTKTAAIHDALRELVAASKAEAQWRKDVRAYNLAWRKAHPKEWREWQKAERECRKILPDTCPAEQTRRPSAAKTRPIMRMNINIDDRLLAEAIKAAEARTKRSLVDQALRKRARRLEMQLAAQRVRGIGWEGDLDAMRRAREF